MKIIDLSILVNEDTPLYPGDPRTKIQTVGVFEKDGYRDHLLIMGNHAGTHIDAPMHMLEEGKGIDGMPVETFVGRGKYIAVDGAFSMEAVRNANIEAGDIVLFYTGMSHKYYETDYFEKYPVLSEEIATYLVEQKVKMVGLDTGSADSAEGFPIHKILLSGDVLIIENLTNIEQLQGLDFMVYALPIKLDIDGAPARVIAVVE